MNLILLLPSNWGNISGCAGTPVSAGIYLYIIQADEEDGTAKMISIINHQAPQVAGVFVYGHLGLEISTFTLFCKNNYPKECGDYAK